MLTDNTSTASPQTHQDVTMTYDGFGYLMAHLDFWSHASFGCVSHFSVVGGYTPDITYRPGYKLDETWVIHRIPDSDDRRLEKNELGLPASK
ncbi:MAG: hypothetical protein K1X36_01135 [Pyrinomonadaceae bacterium]|nr:hypothetical protein [Pyrinomonadaceae bacterium]